MLRDRKEGGEITGQGGLRWAHMGLMFRKLELLSAEQHSGSDVSNLKPRRLVSL